jgi:Pectate lyase superfamily protein
MVDRTPQEFGGVPDGVTDSTAAIQAAIDAAGSSGDDVVIGGGVFRISDQLHCPHDALRIKGDGGIRAMAGTWSSQAAILEITGTGVVLDGDGLLLDQANVIPGGDSLRGAGAVGLTVAGVISRNSQGAFLSLGDGCTDVLVHGIEHRGSGHGILAADPHGLARIRIRDSDFEHSGSGPTGDGIRLDCTTHGGDDVAIVAVTVRGYIGEAVGHGTGYGLVRVTDTQLFGCVAEVCENDGFRWQQQSDDAVVFNCRALSCGKPDHVGDSGSGFIVYDSSRWHGEGLLALGCGYHGIALSGQNSLTHPVENVIVRCSALDIGRDCFHFTAQASATIIRCHARDPSRNSPGSYAAYHLAKQGGATLENLDCVGNSNTVISTGATTPLGDTVVRPESVNCLVNGVTGGTAIARVTEDGTIRVTESGEERLLEAA